MAFQLPITVNDLKTLSTERMQEARIKCQTNLFWFADRILRNKKDPPLVPRVHKGICDTLVQKDPTKPLEEWSPVKQRVILSPRGTLKTVIESADIVQIVLCDPNVRILLLSGKLDLAKSILALVRGHFVGNDALRFLFPEFCVDIDEKSDVFTSPMRGSDVNYREPTLSIGTFESTKAGGHYNWLKLDDCTNEINCATQILVEKTVQSYDDLDPLLEPGGYKDFTATRWAKDDLPEIIHQRGEDYKETEQYKSTGIPQVLYFRQPIWVVNPASSPKEQKERDAREKKHKLEPKDVTLLWPEKLNAQFLWPMYRANARKFFCQYLLNPEAIAEDVHFTLDLLQKQTRPISERPLPHKSAGMFINWDLAGIRSEKGDYSVGIAGDWEFPEVGKAIGRLFLLDCVLERFDSSTEAAYAIVNFFKTHNPEACRIENAAGAKNLEGEIYRLAKEMDVAISIYWGDPETTANAKEERIVDLVDGFKRDLIQFWNGIPNKDEIYKQFLKFARKKSRLDDAPDCIAQLWREYKNKIHPAMVLQAKPTDQPIIWTTPETKEPEFNLPDADEVSAAQEAERWTVPYAR